MMFHRIISICAIFKYSYSLEIYPNRAADQKSVLESLPSSLRVKNVVGQKELVDGLMVSPEVEFKHFNFNELYLHPPQRRSVSGTICTWKKLEPKSDKTFQKCVPTKWLILRLTRRFGCFFKLTA